MLCGQWLWSSCRIKISRRLHRQLVNHHHVEMAIPGYASAGATTAEADAQMGFACPLLPTRGIMSGIEPGDKTANLVHSSRLIKPSLNAMPMQSSRVKLEQRSAWRVGYAGTQYSGSSSGSKVSAATSS